MAEAIINLQALLVKSYLLDALLINRKAFPIGPRRAGLAFSRRDGHRAALHRQAKSSRERRPFAVSTTTWLRERPRVYCSTIETLPAMIVSPACLSRFVDVTRISTKGTPRG
jgi:hypothetical protein